MDEYEDVPIPAEALRKAVLEWVRRFHVGDRWDPEDLHDLHSALVGNVEASPTTHDFRQGRSLVNAVDHPSHYTWAPVEVIEITEHLSFCMGNVVKYVLRADHKGNPIEDLKKARWYLDREIARRKSEAS